MTKLKNLILIFLIASMIFTGCEMPEQLSENDNGTSMFVLIENGEYWQVVYHRETKVMYVVSDVANNRGNFTVMVDADGKPLLYKEAEDDK